jgi:hypothetical protein
MRKAFDWKRSRISMLEVEAEPQGSIPVVVQIGLSIVSFYSQKTEEVLNLLVTEERY